MSRDFNSTNRTRSTILRSAYRGKFNSEAHKEGPDFKDPALKKINFYERQHYGVIDSNNHSIIPNEEFMVFTNGGRLFDFVADSYALLRANINSAIMKNLLSTDGSLFGRLDIINSYKNPKSRYGRYLNGIFQYYNETHIPNKLGITSIASYDDYVNNFFKFFLEEGKNFPLTMTRWNTSYNSNILDTGIAFSFADIPYDADQVKIDRIIDHPCYDYVKKISMNMGFCMSYDNPNILIYDLNSPAGESIRNLYGLYTLDTLFENRFIKTNTVDIELLYNNINLYYNKYVFKNSRIKVTSIQNCKTVSEYIILEPVDFARRPHSDLEELWWYTQIRQREEGDPFNRQKLANIYKKSKYLLKKLDKPSAISYIDSMFKDQVWNKNYGFHDAIAKIRGQTQTEAQRQQTGGGPFRGGSSY